MEEFENLTTAGKGIFTNVKRCLREDVGVFCMLSEFFQNNPQIQRIAFNSDNVDAAYAEDFKLPICDDLNTMLTAVKKNPIMYKFASEEIKCHQRLLYIAIKHKKFDLFEYIPTSVRSNESRKSLKKVIYANEKRKSKEILERQRDDPEHILAMASVNFVVSRNDLSERLLHNSEFIHQLVETGFANQNVCKFVPITNRMMMGFARNPSYFRFISESKTIFHDADCVIELLRSGVILKLFKFIAWVSPHLLDNRTIARILVMKNPKCMSLMSKRLVDAGLEYVLRRNDCLVRTNLLSNHRIEVLSYLE